ncbi:MAG TPA: potassium/proton antiporter [Cyclobacteriaceae bacterium]|jgi:cell volume regulation protein A|nr:potassium/proton antiporter [Cytophagales bacterium]HNT48947.1 potassium/proton antiporter [Cyclobacteriaceae bacterium]HRE65832.1 potassium/proton antiporter [Cyclobacteriaceae bacterium]HRF33676.1 potassium/proton antiporter [Cyclobacteriaceae bacterium]
MSVQIEYILLALSVLFFLSILAGKASSKFGVPALLLFLAVGMLCGSDGLGIKFENIHVALDIGTIALCIILFSGGLDTNISEIRPVMAQGIVLATVGVLLTAFISGVIIWWVFGMTMASAGIGLLTSMLLASTMASTDSASVFSILRSKGLHLKNNLRPMLELESGSNDPMAYILVISLISIIKLEAAPNYWMVIGTFLLQLGIGAVLGFVFGKFSVRIINRIKIGNDSLYPILVFTFCIFIFSATYFAKGNGFLAVYIGGLVIGNSKFVHKRSSLNFFDGLAWMFQLIMFLTLGLLVNPHELLPIIIPGLIISFAMIFFVRPLAVLVCLLPFPKMTSRDKAYISWVGLRGAVPIIFAIYPLVENVPHARLIFNIVFFCTLVSLVVQGTSLPLIARLLNLTIRSRRLKKLRAFDVDFSNDIKSVTTEIEITPNLLSNGNQLMNLPLPEHTLAVMVRRGENYFVPTGNTVLKVKDKILIITDDHSALVETYKNLGIDV